MDVIVIRRNNGTAGYIPRLQRKSISLRVGRLWCCPRGSKPEVRKSK